MSRNYFSDSLGDIFDKLFHPTTTISLDFSYNNVAGNFDLSSSVQHKLFPYALLVNLVGHNNNLTGKFSMNVFEHFSALKLVDLSHNHFNAIVVEQLSSPSMRVLDLRANNFEQDSLDLKYWEELNRDEGRPVVYNLTGSRSLLLCPTIKQPQRGSHNITLFFPPKSFNYNGCRCASGFGKPPNCAVADYEDETRAHGTLTDAGFKALKKGQEAAWWIRPSFTHFTARVIYLNFTLFTISDNTARLNVYLNSARGARVLAFSADSPPQADQELMVGNEKDGTSGNVYIHFETDLMTQKEFIKFAYRAVDECPPLYTKKGDFECVAPKEMCNSPKKNIGPDGKCVQPEAKVGLITSHVTRAVYKPSDSLKLFGHPSPSAAMKVPVQIKTADDFAFVWESSLKWKSDPGPGDWSMAPLVIHMPNTSGKVDRTTPNTVDLVFEPTYLRALFNESNVIHYIVEFKGRSAKDDRVAISMKNVTVTVNVRALPSVRKSSLTLIGDASNSYAGRDILEDSTVAVRIDAKDEDGESISDKSKMSLIVTWKKGGAPGKNITLRYKEGYFSAHLLSHASSGSYTLWVSAVEVELETGTQKYIIESDVLASAWTCGLAQGLPTSSSNCLVRVCAHTRACVVLYICTSRVTSKATRPYISRYTRTSTYFLHISCMHTCRSLSLPCLRVTCNLLWESAWA